MDSCSFDSGWKNFVFVDYFSFFLFPVPFNFLLYDICKSRYHKGALIFPILYLANMAVTFCFSVQELLIYSGCYPQPMLLWLPMQFTQLPSFFTRPEKKATMKPRNSSILCVLIVFGMVEMFLYYLRKFQQTSILLPIGTLLFIIMLIWIQVSQYYDQYIQKQKVIYLQKIANMDMLTEAMNRKRLRGHGEISGGKGY